MAQTFDITQFLHIGSQHLARAVISIAFSGSATVKYESKINHRAKVVTINANISQGHLPGRVSAPNTSKSLAFSSRSADETLVPKQTEKKKRITGVFREYDVTIM